MPGGRVKSTTLPLLLELTFGARVTGPRPKEFSPLLLRFSDPRERFLRSELTRLALLLVKLTFRLA